MTPEIDEQPIEEAVGEALRDRDETLAIAESVTGGLTASRVTDAPGSSDYFDRAWIVYGYDAWRTAVGVSRGTLDEHGAVSEDAAAELATRARDLSDATWGISTTGVAGPGGGSESTPVGTAFVGVAFAAPWGSGESFAKAERRRLEGSRETIRAEIAREALELLGGELAARSE